jgi:hypothetical protein
MEMIDYRALVTVLATDIAPEPMAAVDGLCDFLRNRLHDLFQRAGAKGIDMNTRFDGVDGCFAFVRFKAPATVDGANIASGLRSNLRERFSSARVEIDTAG